MKTSHRFASMRPLTMLGLAGAAVMLVACGGGSDDGMSRSDVLAVQEHHGEQRASAAAGPQSEGGVSYVASQALVPWVPQVTDTWQWQLSGTVNTSYDVKVYDIDLFDVPDSVFNTLHSQGRYVVCYFSAGSSEDWRPDFNQFLPSDMGNKLGGWPGERWLDTRSANVRNIMKARLDKAKARGCDGVEPDNVDGYKPAKKTGFPLTYDTQLDYNRFLATEARARGLKVALKNDVEQVADLASSFDFAVNEQCHQYTNKSYNECAGYTLFTNAGKPVFNAEYKKTWRDDANARAQMCAIARSQNLRTLVLPLKLNDTFRYSCD